jgi:ElaA protein
MEIYVKRFEELSLEELYEIIKIRVAIFCLEQNCLYQDLDDKDKKAYHVYIKENDKIKAYLRVLDKGISFDEISIGRVLTTERGMGFGNVILREGIRVAKEMMNADKIKIEAQSYAKGYYEKFGFKQISDEFLEDGIPHIKMILDI